MASVDKFCGMSYSAICECCMWTTLMKRPAGVADKSETPSHTNVIYFDVYFLS